MKPMKKFAKIVLVGLLLIGFMVPAVSGAGKVNINTDGRTGALWEAGHYTSPEVLQKHVSDY